MVTLAIAATVGVGRWMRASDGASKQPSIAVLPFRSLGADSSTAHFSAGLQDELLTQLSGVASLRVVGRTSVAEYGGSEKPVEQIARELGVRSVALGSVQVDGDRLRVIMRLVDASTRQDLWGARYDRTLEDVFAVQSDIARQIVAALGARLTIAEAGTIGELPTANAEAYQLYLQGRDYHRRPGLLRQDLLTAERLYLRAVALDSMFGAAHAALARVILDRYTLKYERTEARLALGKREAEIALRLSPGLAESHHVAGLVLGAEGRSDEALRRFRAGLRIAPSHPDLWAGIGQVHARLGQFDSAIVAINTALQFDPRASNLLQKLGDTYHVLHRYPEAIAAYRRELALAPDLVQPHLSLAWSYVLWTGQVDTLRAAIASVPLDADMGLGAGTVLPERMALAVFERKPDTVLALARAGWGRALGRPPDPSGHFYWTVPAYRMLRDTVAERSTIDSVLQEVERQLRERPNAPGIREERASLLALVGRRDEALREATAIGEWNRRQQHRTEDWRVDRARIFVYAGELDSAFAELEHLVRAPSLVTAHYLQLDPWWEPAAKDSRFKEVVRAQSLP